MASNTAAKTGLRLNRALRCAESHGMHCAVGFGHSIFRLWTKSHLIRSVRFAASLSESTRAQRKRPWLLLGTSAAAATSATLAALAAHAEPGMDEASLPREYDACALADYWGKRPWTVRKRMAEVASEMIPFALRLLSDRRAGALIDDAVCRQRAQEAREMLTRLGPAFIKAGQALSIRPDLLPTPALKELQRLCDDCPASEWSVVRATLETELGNNFLDFFDLPTEPPVPIAAASLGQVYRWRLRGTGQVVAVKVQRPDMAHAVALDVYILRHIAWWVRFALRRATLNRIDHVKLLDVWAGGTIAELDYESEARNQEEFRQSLDSFLQGRVYVPEVITNFTTRHVLVTEWVDGPRLADCPVEVVRALVPAGVECFLAQLLDIGRFHSDPHPGNMLVKGGNQLVLIDFGLVARIDRCSMDRLATAVVHMVSAQYDALFEDLVALDFLPAEADKAHILPPLQSVLEQGMRAGGDIKRRKKNFQSITDDLSTVFYEMPFNVPDYFALITRALAVLEGIALVGDPEFDIFWAAYPYALSKARSLLGDRRVAGLLTAAAARAAQQLSAEERMAFRHRAASELHEGNSASQTESGSQTGGDCVDCAEAPRRESHWLRNLFAGFPSRREMLAAVAG